MKIEELGKKQATLMSPKHYSIARYENGIRIKPWGENPIFLSKKEAKWLIDDIKTHIKMWECKEEFSDE